MTKPIIEVSSWMIDKITKGDAILFLGAGAAYGALDKNQKASISGNELRDRLSDKFLGGKEKSKALVQIADYAKSEANIKEVQSFIKKQFQNLQPALFHKLIPTFRWHAIFTTNYDLIIERAYDQVTERVQTLSPIIRDGSQFSDAISNPENLPYFKLHGCINIIDDWERTSNNFLWLSNRRPKHPANFI